MAGVAAAAKDNGAGIAGVAPDAKLVVAKVLDSAGQGSEDDIVAGIKWVVDHGAGVVNLSRGGNSVITSLFGTELAEGINYAWSHGAVAVIAWGNENLFGLGLGSQQYGELNALVVGASGPDDEVASYSSPTGNAKWSLVAPGGAGVGNEADDIYSTFWRPRSQSHYAYLAGTSMATPHVAGAVPLLLAQGHSPQQAVSRILDTADATVSCGTGARPAGAGSRWPTPSGPEGASARRVARATASSRPRERPWAHTAVKSTSAVVRVVPRPHSPVPLASLWVLKASVDVAFRRGRVWARCRARGGRW